MAERQLPTEVRIIWRGLQVLTVLTFTAFFVWAVIHLVRLFQS